MIVFSLILQAVKLFRRLEIVRENRVALRGCSAIRVGMTDLPPLESRKREAYEQGDRYETVQRAATEAAIGAIAFTQSSGRTLRADNPPVTKAKHLSAVMKSDKPSNSTRERILDAALALIQAGHGPASMGDIAKAAQLSRQTLYLVFENKADIYIALVRRVDEMRGMPAAVANVEGASNGLVALEEMIAMQARMLPSHRQIGNAVDTLRRIDPDAERAWQDRGNSRYRLCASIIKRLHSEGTLRPGLSIRTATDILWVLSSFRLWSELVCDKEWSSQRYKKEIFSLALTGVTRKQKSSTMQAPSGKSRTIRARKSL